jgi:hypothetical protein
VRYGEPATNVWRGAALARALRPLYILYIAGLTENVKAGGSRELPSTRFVHRFNDFVFCAARRTAKPWVIRGSRLLSTLLSRDHDRANLPDFLPRAKAAPLQACCRRIADKRPHAPCFQGFRYSLFSDAISITNRYFTWPLIVRSQASLICWIGITSTSDVMLCAAQ